MGSSATTALYGTHKDPSTGILNVITSGLAQAAQNYSNCESKVTQMFNAFSGGSSGSVNQTPVTDQVTNNVYHTTSVDETF
jgi:hypothetical protein